MFAAPAGGCAGLAANMSEEIEMECKKQENLARCNCTYDCSKKGMCCECIQYHLSMKQLPGCCFPNEVEKTYDRSFKAFARAWKL